MSYSNSNNDRTSTSAPVNKGNKEFRSAIFNDLRAISQAFAEGEELAGNLSRKDRKRLINAQARKTGFIIKAFNIARDYPQFMSADLKAGELTDSFQKFNELRQIVLGVQQFQQHADNALIQQSDLCYRVALSIYHNLRAKTKTKNPDADPLYQDLRAYFRSARKSGSETESEEIGVAPKIA